MIQTQAHAEFRVFLEGRTWPLTTYDKLPSRCQNDLKGSFGSLSSEGQAYYLPAFLIMCERNPERVGEFPNWLMRTLASGSSESVELRSKLTPEQSMCILTFFEDWCGREPAKSAVLRQLRKRLTPRAYGSRCAPMGDPNASVAMISPFL